VFIIVAVFGAPFNSSSSLYSNSRKKKLRGPSFCLACRPTKMCVSDGKTHTQRKKEKRKRKRREEKKIVTGGPPRALHGHGKHSPLVVITWDRKAVQSYGNFFFFWLGFELYNTKWKERERRGGYIHTHTIYISNRNTYIHTECVCV
jgi:hypothetical protein